MSAPSLEPSEVVLPVTFGRRLHFVWLALMVAIFTFISVTGVMIHRIFQPSLYTFFIWSRFWARAILKTTGIRVVAEHVPDLPKNESYIFIGNHQNALDVLVASGYMPIPFGYLAKVELKSAPLIGLVLNAFCVFVDRTTARKALESLKEAAEIIRSGHSVLIFPEGQRAWSNQLGTFLRGAYDLAVTAGVPLVPFTLKDNYLVVDERRYVSRPGTVHLAFHPILPVAGCTKKDIPDLLAASESVIRGADLLPDAGAIT